MITSFHFLSSDSVTGIYGVRFTRVISFDLAHSSSRRRRWLSLPLSQVGKPKHTGCVVSQLRAGRLAPGFVLVTTVCSWLLGWLLCARCQGFHSEQGNMIPNCKHLSAGLSTASEPLYTLPRSLGNTLSLSQPGCFPLTLRTPVRHHLL